MFSRRIVACGFAALLPALVLEGAALATGAPWSWPDVLSRWGFPTFILIGASLLTWSTSSWRSYAPLALLALVGGVTAGIMPGLPTLGAAVALGVWYIGLLHLDGVLSQGYGILRRWTVHGLIAVIAGMGPMAITQVQSGFAEEEFFVAFQAGVLIVFWMCLLLLWRRAVAKGMRPVVLEPRWRVILVALLIGSGVSLAAVTVQAYQKSFYSWDVPTYASVSEDDPFECGEARPARETYEGEAVFESLLSLVQANPHKGVPEFGMLAIATKSQRWAERFRRALLEEARAGRFTKAAHSVKSTQFKASLRAYYFSRVQEIFPSLFSKEDLAKLKEWFAAINERAHTVEWVDLLYALAFAKYPQGPYENQENGAGLLALLETEGLAKASLSRANRAYLAQNHRGWAKRFRNTDDADFYQLEWITNALFQQAYFEDRNPKYMEQAFKWLLLQALPTGAMPAYNHPHRASLAGVGYLGAQLLGNHRYLWLAGRAVNAAHTQGRYLFAQPGVEQAVEGLAHSPQVGSCLLYGDSGLPNQKGPLAPDKIVFREGWSDEDAYVLLNLRFSGWHRYRAANAIVRVYQGGSVVTEATANEPFEWLPEGRSLVRDKRVPRENLNGLVVERVGLSAVLKTLTGIGTRWAQDPPQYAEVVTFKTGSALDISHTRLPDWHGWRHDRKIYLYHNQGPIVVVDQAEGPTTPRAGLVWHFPTHTDVNGSNAQVRIRPPKSSMEIVFLPIIPARAQASIHIEKDENGRHLMYSPVNATELEAVTVFLPNSWSDAEIEVRGPIDSPHVTISRQDKDKDKDKEITIPL